MNDTEALSITLYHYWRSSCSWRLRWALNIKGIEAKKVHIHLLKEEQKHPSYIAVNPSGYVPCVVWEGKTLTESLAILEWLDELVPRHPLLHGSVWYRAQQREIASMIATGIQPLQNLKTQFRHSNDAKERELWSTFFIKEGLKAVEKKLQQCAGLFAVGDMVSMADIFLVPQIYNALRLNIDMRDTPLSKDIYERCLEDPFCAMAAPDRQAEAQ